MKSFGDDAGRLDGQQVVLELQVAPGDAPGPGSLIAADLKEGQLWVTVEQTRILSEGTGGTVSKLSISGTSVGVSGTGVWWTGRAPDSLPSDVRAAEKLSFELWVRQADAYALSISGLGFHPEGARFWAQLPTDREVYLYDETAPVKAPTSDLWQPLGADQRFPLAGPPRQPAFFFPLGMRPVPEQFLRPVRLPGSALERDGLAEFGAALFLDPDLLSTGTEALPAHADALRYTNARPRQLTGLHAAYGIEEVTLVAAPDAVQRGWTQRDTGAAPEVAKSDPLLAPRVVALRLSAPARPAARLAAARRELSRLRPARHHAAATLRDGDAEPDRHVHTLLDKSPSRTGACASSSKRLRGSTTEGA